MATVWAASVLTIACVGCVSPSYRDSADASGSARHGDGGLGSIEAGPVDAAPTHDASKPTGNDGPDAGDAGASMPPPAWAAHALGQYALRTRFFGRALGLGSAINVLASEWVWLSTVSYDALRDQVRMSSTICRGTGTNTFAGAVVNVELRYPTALPEHAYQLVSDGKEWHSVGEPRAYGWRDMPLVACPQPGAEVTCAQEQSSWLPNGKCSCAADPTARPSSADDCRIDDDDIDRQPGITVVATGQLNATYYVRATDGSDFVHGTFDQRGGLAGAFYAQVFDTLQVGCNPEPCPRSDSTPCDPPYNPATLVKLGELEATSPRTCDDVLGQYTALFSQDALTFPPEGC